MTQALPAWYTANSTLLVVGYAVALIIVALRSTGRRRTLATLGLSLHLLGTALSVIVLRIIDPMTFLGSGMHLAFTVLTGVLGLASLLLLASALIVRPTETTHA